MNTHAPTHYMTLRVSVTRYLFPNGSVLLCDRALTEHGSAPLGARVAPPFGKPGMLCDIGRDVAAAALLDARRKGLKVRRSRYIAK